MGGFARKPGETPHAVAQHGQGGLAIKGHPDHADRCVCRKSSTLDSKNFTKTKILSHTGRDLSTVPPVPSITFRHDQGGQASCACHPGHMHSTFVAPHDPMTRVRVRVGASGHSVSTPDSRHFWARGGHTVNPEHTSGRTRGIRRTNPSCMSTQQRGDNTITPVLGGQHAREHIVHKPPHHPSTRV